MTTVDDDRTDSESSEVSEESSSEPVTESNSRTKASGERHASSMMRPPPELSEFERLGSQMSLPAELIANQNAMMKNLGELAGLPLLKMHPANLPYFPPSLVARDLGEILRNAVPPEPTSEFVRTIQDANKVLFDTYMPAFPSLNWQDVDLRGLLPNSDVLDVVNAVQRNLSAIAESVVGGFDDVFANLKFPAPPLPTIDFFKNLPDLRQLNADIDAAVAQLVSSQGFFMFDYWSLATLARFVGLDSVHPRVRSAVATNILLNVTRRPRFEARCQEKILSSTLLKRRWPVLSQAYTAHKARQYAVSIPTLLAQIEGIFTDALVLKGIAMNHKGKLVAKGQDGTPKLDKNNKPIVLKGLQAKVEQSELRRGRFLDELAQFLVDYLVPRRNDIMHGSAINYDKARLSAQLLMYITMLANEFVAFEGESSI